jgi:hypothetical protein
MKRPLLTLGLWLALCASAAAQNPTCPTRPAGDSSNACASTNFVTSAINTISATFRHLLTSNYFVDDINGNDSNACTSATVGACKTLNGVVSKIAVLDLILTNVTVNVAAPASSYAGMACLNPWVGGGTVTFIGNTTTPTNVLVAGGGSPAFDIENGCKVNLRGFSVSSTGAATIQAWLGSQIIMTKMDLAGVAAGFEAIFANRGGSYIELNDSIGSTTIHSGAAGTYLIVASHTGEVRISCTTACLSYTANSTYSQEVLLADHGDITGTPSASFALNGFTVTGNKYVIISTGSIQWNGLMPPNEADIPGLANSGTYCSGTAGAVVGPAWCLLGNNGGSVTFNELIGGTNGTIFQNQANNATLATLLNSGFFGLGSGNASPQAPLSVSGNTATSVATVLSGASTTTSQLVGKDTFVAAQEVSAFGNEALLIGARADGTAASKATIAAANEPIFANFAYGWNGSAYVAASGFIMWSSEAYTGAHTGSYLSLYSGIVEAVRLQPSGGFSVGAVTTDPGIGNITARSYMSSGTVPVGTTGSCVASSFVGGATAGKFSAAVCAAGTIILSSLPTAPNGYTCNAQDQTTPADTLKQTANTTTSVTFTSTTVAADVVVFQCMAW